MSSSGKLPLRILYSLNGSPQYILARSQGAVPVQYIPSHRTAGASSSRSKAQPTPCYASASLKTCLNTICRSSPEIIQDRTRDFTVYLLDPLETDCAPAQVNISHSLSKPSVPEVPEARVAVALGLMSWGLSTDETDTMSVAGTLKASAMGQEMLEIIFSLRETIPMEKASLPEALRTWGLPTSSSSSHKGRGKRKSRALPMKPLPIPVTEADKLMAAPNYIGPERRPPGRPWRYGPPPGTSENDDVVVVDGPTPSSDNDRRVRDFMALLQAIAPGMERNKALGNVLGLVHGSDGTAVHPPPELEDAMVLFSDLQRAQSFPNHSQPEGPRASSSQHRRKSSSADSDEIVVLNKENVNPTVFRRRAEREAKLLGSVEPAASLPSAPPSNSTSHMQPEASRLTPSNQLTRKRTLSEFMEEQESVREKEKAQKRYYRQPERAMSEESIRQAALENDSKPSRTRTISTTSSPGKEPAVRRPRLTTSASSPVRPPRKKYVVPAWARTETATQPRLSEEAIQQAQLKKEEEDKKKREARRKQTKEEKAGLKEEKCRKHAPTKPAASRISRSASAPVTPPGAKPLLLPPVAASGEFPMFVSVHPVQSPSRAAPCTPPRKRRANTISTPGPSSLFTPASSSCLFTPASGSWETSGVLSLGRSSVSPSSRKASTDKPQPAGNPESDDDLLGQELDSAFDDFDFPPSSLPIASSDIEVDVETGQMPSSGQEYDSDDSEEDDAPPKQHWVGLPPSSPPPQSSPFMGATQMDDDDVDEAPLTTPDADVVSEPEMVDSLNMDTEVTEYSMEELGKLLNIDDLANFFPSTDTDTATLFDQFTNQTLSSDDSSQIMTDWGLDSDAENLNPDFDFTEFWESVKPLVEGPDINQDPGLSEMGSLDNAKLAGDVHALFSGCLV
ncbi:hypothetical protein B0H17DRAFT_1064495 [Mycena rosella]|uniref:Ams2/SPT21 N-terminal domain-containing protein n=1 Tax=Mycena rosella TaxID=1033263 RepID=A0AAD7DGV7_MYCRO|nr:hypothetical protein B0H17DRAFT_1064495 [Mycena rosella]